MADKLLFVLSDYKTYPTLMSSVTQCDMVRRKRMKNLQKLSPILDHTLVH